MGILNCGLTKYELRKMLYLKVIGSVILENVPQLIFQGLYVVHLDGVPSCVALLSMTASVFSIIAALLSWLIERKASHCVVIEYSIDVSKNSPLTVAENKKIQTKKERTASLTKNLCQALSIPKGQMEMRYATRTPT